MKKLFLFISIGFLSVSCGIKGLPLPPLDENQNLERKVEPLEPNIEKANTPDIKKTKKKK